MMLVWIVKVVVDTVDNVERPLFNRSGHNHFLHPPLKIRGESFGGAKLARAF